MSRWNAADAAHLYRRAGFGAGRERIERAVDRGRETALEDIFSRRTHEESLVRGLRPLLALGQIEVLAAWWMNVILRDTAPLVERVTLMWHNHFATSNDKVNDVRLMHGQIQLFRDKGLGDFRELLHAVARDPAMLVWLDGNANRRGQPNENFAREVLELFGLGIGNYTEHDIKEAARAFSGWGLDGRAARFRDQYFDAGSKEIFGQRGNFDADDAIDLILAHPACARHIARRLLTEFVLPEPTAATVYEWARILQEEEWNIERTLERLLRSELFASPAARRSRIAGPVELVAITVITLGAKVPARDAMRGAAEMGQSLFRPPSVKGWDGGRTWIHTGSWLARHNHLTAVARAHGERVDLASSYGRPAHRGQVPDAALALLLPEGVDPSFQEVLARAAAESDDLDDALRRVTGLILTSPEYHLV